MAEVGEGEGAGVSGSRQDGEDVLDELGSGRYVFAYPFGG
jgi:hypothetical protein